MKGGWVAGVPTHELRVWHASPLQGDRPHQGTQVCTTTTCSCWTQVPQCIAGLHMVHNMRHRAMSYKHTVMAQHEGHSMIAQHDGAARGGTA
jgi:hypothetical protein